MNTHGNVVFSSQTYRDWVGVGGDDVILGVAPLFHITGLIAHIGLSLLTGAPLVLDHRFDAARALELIERHRVTFTTGAITVFIALMDAPEAARARHLVAAHDRQRRGADRARDRRGLRGALRHLHPQHLRADGDDLALALRADRDAGARSTRPRARCRSASRSTAPSCAWSARTAATCRRARSARSSPRARRSSRATGGARRRASAPSRAGRCTRATSASWTPTAGSTWSTARRTRSTPPATRSGRARSRTSSTAIRPCARPPSSASPTPIAARRSRPSSACAPASARTPTS